MFSNYFQNGVTYDDMIAPDGSYRQHYALLIEYLSALSLQKLHDIQYATSKAQLAMGMTFNVYHDKQSIEKILHLDIIPRIINAREWELIETGLKQRVYALNCFIHDIYNEQHILKDKIVPTDLILSSTDYLKPCIGITPPQKIWCHITGTDLVRDQKGDYYILEDNLRCPSGASYLLENREISKRTFPEQFGKMGVRPISDYPINLLKMLQYLSPKDKPVIGVLTPGIYNSAYSEHSYLAHSMGVELITGQDLTVENNKVFMQTTSGLQQVDVLYRRIDDTFMDPLVFNPKSMLGIPGLFNVWKSGNVGLANAPGTGVADDKAVYTYVPDIIRYYLKEEPLLPNVPTWLCSNKKDLAFVLENIADLVVKRTDSAGGYGMLIGTKATKKEHREFAELIKASPDKYIAQPTLSLSTVPTLTGEGIEPRHVDLRPYVLYGDQIEVVPSALTRVALKKGSLVVNSSQGGGTKDTWVLYQ